MKETIEVLRKMTETITEDNYDDKYLLSVVIELIGGLSFINLLGEYVYLNEEYSKTCGYVEGELVGAQWIKTVHPEDVAIATECYFDMLKNGKSSLKFRGVRKDGQIFNKSITLVKKTNSKDEIIGHYCFMKEI